jgi:hypothetical protein
VLSERAPHLTVEIANHLPDAPEVVGLRDRHFRALVRALIDHGAGRGLRLTPASHRALTAAGLVSPEGELTDLALRWIGRTSRGGQRAPIPLSTRIEVFTRDGFACVECGASERLQLDHRYPWSRGGSDDPSNLQTLCGSCNSSKGARVP